jgi:hypothetical protein
MTAAHFLRSRLFIISALSLCIFAVTATLSIYYAQGQGMCLRSARVLSEHELRQAMLINLIDSRIEYLSNWESIHDYDWAGISSPTQETDIQKLINTSFNNEKSFEENFGLKIILKGRKKEKFTPNQISEPLLFVEYGTRPNGWAWIYSSSDIQKVAFAQIKAKNKTNINRQITRYKRLLGYGNHYFRFNFSIISRECCDNRDKDSKEYLARKREAYESSISSIDPTFQKTMKEDSPSVIMVSNCGDIMKDNNGHFSYLGVIHRDDDNP